MIDTENYDHAEVKELLVENSDLPVSVFFIGIGDAEFKELVYLNDFQSYSIPRFGGEKKAIRQNTKFYQWKNQKDLPEFEEIMKNLMKDFIE